MEIANLGSECRNPKRYVWWLDRVNRLWCGWHAKNDTEETGELDCWSDCDYQPKKVDCGSEVVYSFRDEDEREEKWATVGYRRIPEPLFRASFAFSRR